MTPFLRFIAALLTIAAGAAYGQSVVTVSGDQQTVPLDSLTTPHVFRVLDAQGQPMPGVTVDFDIVCFFAFFPGPCASFVPTDELHPVTDANGLVSSPRYRTNGVAGGSVLGLHVRLPGGGMLEHFFSVVQVTDSGLNPGSVEIVSGNNQSLLPGEVLQTLVARVRDTAGQPMRGVGVTFRNHCNTFDGSSACSTSISAIMVNTDSDGLARGSGLVANGIPGTFSIRFGVFWAMGDAWPSTLFNHTNLEVAREALAQSPTGTGMMSVKLMPSASRTCTVDMQPLSFAQVPERPKMLAFPHGVARVVLKNCAVGESISLSFTHPGGMPEGSAVWAAAPGWQTLLSTSAVSGTTSFSLVDGGAGDVDGARNGQIEALVGMAYGNPDSPNFQDLWWAGSSENGWGLSIAQQRDTLFSMIFAYDTTGQATWFAMPGGSWNESRDVYSGALYSPRGKPLGEHDAADLAVGSAAGTASISFTDSMNATLEVNIDGVVSRKQLSRQLFGPMDATQPLRRGGMWWAGAAQNGWGLVLQQQYSSLFGLVFTYRADGSPTWYAMPSGYWSGADTYEGIAYRATSSSWPLHYDASRLASEQIGGFKLGFSGEGAAFDITANGVPRRFELVPLPF